MSTEAPLKPGCYIFHDVPIDAFNCDGHSKCYPDSAGKLVPVEKQPYRLLPRRHALAAEELSIHSNYYDRVVEFSNDPIEGEEQWSEPALKQWLQNASNYCRSLYIFHDIEDIHTTPAFQHLLRSAGYYNITVWLITPDHNNIPNDILYRYFQFYTPTWHRVQSWASCAPTAS